MLNVLSATSDTIIGMLSNVVYTIINPIPLFEWLIISDGICNSINFIWNYRFAKNKMINNSINEKGRIGESQSGQRWKNDVIDKYNKLYKLELLDRYILYLFLYSNCVFLSLLMPSDNINTCCYICFTIFTIPMVQNKCIEWESLGDRIREFGDDKIRFIKYTISKLTIKGIKELDKSIVGIKNYHIFILYKYISLDYLLDFIKCYILIYSLYFLRHSLSTYYYYKAIKIAYYYNTGYLFNIITLDDAIFNINNMIKEKRWRDLNKIENVHSLYTILQSNLNNSDKKQDLYLYTIAFFTLWSSICFLKVINYLFLIIGLTGYIVFNTYNDKMYIINNYKKIFISYVGYILICLGINDLVITLVCVNYRVLYYICNEIYFYMQNKNDIKKVLLFYK